MINYIFAVIIYIRLLQLFGLSEGHGVETNKASERTFHGKINISYPTAWVEDVSFDECVQECKFRPSCTAVNYHTFFNLCELDLEPGPEVVSTKDRAVLYWIKTKQEDTVECGTNSCRPGYVCSIEKNKCEIKECLPLPISNSTTILGNVNKVRGKIKMRCYDEFVAQGPAAITLTCGRDILWSPEPLMCSLPVRLISQWVDRVHDFSSEYSSTVNAASQIVGEPGVYPAYRASEKAWSTLKGNRNEFIEVDFETTVKVTTIEIYETFVGGVVTGIMCFQEGAYHSLYIGKIKPVEGARIFSPVLTSSCISNRLRIEAFTAPIIRSGRASWMEIDAIRLNGTLV